MLNKEMLLDIILYICNEVPVFENGVLKVNKLLWFIESEYYRQFSRMITDTVFVAINYGPVFDDYKDVFTEMEDAGLLDIDRRSNSRWLLTPKVESHLGTLSSEEKLIVTEVVDKMKPLSELALRKLSHRDAYYITVNENSDQMGKAIDMKLVFLESSPLVEDGFAVSPDLSETEEILKKHAIDIEV